MTWWPRFASSRAIAAPSLASRWAVLVLRALSARPHRFRELGVAVDGVSDKMLAATLQTLTGDGLVCRSVGAGQPPAVTYSITELGRGAVDALQPFMDWVRANADAITADGARAPVRPRAGREYRGPEILTIGDELTDAYVEIFTAPPWDHRDPGRTATAFRERLATDAHRPGFRALVSFAPTGEIDGFTTGWTTQAPFRTDRAYGKVIDRLGADRVDTLLVGALEVDELGVRRRARSTGLGRRLLTELTTSRRAWLLTWDQAHDTLAFYRRIGWLEPEPVPGSATDVVVFTSPTPAGPAATGARP
jgi:DNA-binding HxlR family transcriptional regulator/GNAT superfamily N-acetyltransferase